MTQTEEKPWYTKRKVIAALVLIGIIILCTFIGWINKLNSPNVCASSNCAKVGRRIAAWMDTSVDPCEDFAAYACGGWIKSNPIPDGQDSLATFDSIREQALEKLKTGFKKREGKSKSVRLVLDLYQECLNTTARDARGGDPLRELLKEVLGSSEWPVVEEATMEHLSRKVQINGDLLKTLARMAQLNVSPLIVIKIGKDGNTSNSATSKKIVTFFAPSFGLSRDKFAENENLNSWSDIDSYKELNLNFAKIFYRNSSTLSDNFNLDYRLRNCIDEMYSVEKSLAMATLQEDKISRQNPTAHYRRLTLQEFTDQTDNYINYTDYLNSFAELLQLSYRFNSTDQVVVTDFGYYKALRKTLPKRSQLLNLYNYLGLKLAWRWAEHTDKVEREFRLKHRNYWTRGVWTGESLLSPSPPQWQECFQAVDGWAASRIYIDRLNEDSDTINAAGSMVDELQAAFTETFRRDVDWMSTDTRSKALEKESQIRHYIAYPHWLRDDAVLDQQMYGYAEQDSYVKVEQGHYFEGQVDMVKRTTAVPWRQFHQPEGDYEFPYFPYSVEAKVTQEKNAITIPIAFIQPPSFDAGLPFYLNYGATGAFIAHEMTHLFDDKGAQYNSKGNLANWWSEETEARFKKRTKCFAEQYKSMIVKKTGVYINGLQFIGEHIADEGVRQAFLAMETRLQKDEEYKEKVQTVPQVEKFSPQQLFFLSFAQMRCEKHRNEKKMDIIRSAPLPGEYRINVPLSNLKQFSTAFSCPAGSKMNPRKKCQLW